MNLWTILSNQKKNKRQNYDKLQSFCFAWCLFSIRSNCNPRDTKCLAFVFLSQFFLHQLVPFAINHNNSGSTSCLPDKESGSFDLDSGMYYCLQFLFDESFMSRSFQRKSSSFFSYSFWIEYLRALQKSASLCYSWVKFFLLFVILMPQT